MKNGYVNKREDAAVARWAGAAVVGLVGALGGMTMHAETVRADATGVSVVPVMTSDQFLVAGEVVARTESELTVVTRLSEVRTLQVSEDTAITKGGATLRLPDVMVGDKVNVTVSRGGEGRLRAVTVTVRTGFE